MSKTEIDGIALSFPTDIEVDEISESHPEFKKHQAGLSEIAPDFLGAWRVKGPKGECEILFQELNLNIHGDHRKMLGWQLKPSSTETATQVLQNTEKFETAEEMRDRVLELLK